MSTKKKNNGFMSYIKSKLLLRLWATNMLLVIVIIAFLWLVQIQLFEQNYLKAAMSDTLNKAKVSAEELEEVEEIDLDDKNNPLNILSRTVIGKVFLVNNDDKILYTYSTGKKLNPTYIGKELSWLTDETPNVISGNDYNEIRTANKLKGIAVGVPAVYKGEPAALLVYSNLTEIDTIQSLNREQLMILSVIMIIIASIISLLLSRHFSKPIQKIEGTVKKMTLGEYDAKPGVKRSDEIGQLSNSVEDLGQELQSVEKLRKEVIANISHELRAPLSLISGYSEMVRDVAGNDEKVRNDSMNLILNESKRLSEMVDDIMDYSKLQAGYLELNLEEYNLFEIVESSIEYGRNAALQYEIKIAYKSFSEQIPVQVDALKLSQVMRNLINNAINHTADGEKINVDITQNDKSICVSVTNPGKELTKDDLKVIWERYQRVQHQAGRKEGTGIGLAIVKTIFISHGMDYGVDSNNGMNRFWFTILK